MEMMDVDDCMAEFFVTEQVAVGKKTYVLERRTPDSNARMKPSTSKTTTTSSPPPEEPTAQYVNTDLPNPDDEPLTSDLQGIISSDELHRQKSQAAAIKYNKVLPEMLADHRAVTSQLHQRYSEDEERKRIEQQKNKEAMSAAAPAARNGHADSRKRRNEPTAEEEWKRSQWMGQHAFPGQHYQQQQQYMMMQQQQMAHGMQMHHHMPSTSSAESVHSVPTPASMHQPSPANNGMNPPSMDRNEENLAVPEGDWFDELAVAVAKQYSDTVLGPDTYDVLTELDFPAKVSPATFSDRLPSAPTSAPPPSQQQLQMQQQQEANKLRMLHIQAEEQRQRQFQQQQHLQQQRHQMLLHQQQQQQMQQQQPQMNGQFATQQAYMQQQMRMQQMRYHQQQQQQHQQQAHHQQQSQMMGGYGVPNGYPQQMHVHPSYGHHTAFANMN